MSRLANVRVLVLFALLAFFATASCQAPPPERPRETSAHLPDAGLSPVHVRLLAFNDFHGTLKPPTGGVPGVSGAVGGAAWLAAHLRRLGAGRPDTLVVAAGDVVGASPLASALFHDEPTVEVMNAIGLSVTCLGNHELDEGIDELLRLSKGGCHPKDGCRSSPTFTGAKYAILGANVLRKGAPPPLPAYVVREVSGVPIAFVGMTLAGTAGVVTPEAVFGLEFAEEVATANALVPEIRARGVEAIVLLVHEGGDVDAPSLDGCHGFRGPIVGILERLDPAYDVVVSGHTHQLYDCRVGGRPVTSALSFGRVVTALDLTIDPRTRDVVRVETKNHAITHDVPPDPTVARIVARAAEAAAPLENRVIGRITATLSSGARGRDEAALVNLVADAQLEATRKSGAEVAVVNATGIRSDLVFARSGDEKEDGLVTYGEAFAAQPFANDLVTITITADALAAALAPTLREGSPLHVSEGLVVRYHGKAETERVELVLRGARLKPGSAVRVTTNSFLVAREPAFAGGRDRVVGPLDLDALEAYFVAHTPVPPPKPRIFRD